MKPGPGCILTINAGSSSIRFACHDSTPPHQPRLSGKIDRIGLGNPSLTCHDANGIPLPVLRNSDDAPPTSPALLLDWLESWQGFPSIRAIGHRVVHGMLHSTPELITPALLQELHRIEPYAPEHLPREIDLIQAFRQRLPQLPQVACFDTAFHRTMPRVARWLPIPRRFDARGIQRFGFHGLSYAFLMEELTRLGDPAATRGRVLLAHLGNGASLAAVRDGLSIDTSMGFTPSSGLVMGSRSGDLDPGLPAFLANTEGITTPQFLTLVNQESGLLGISETTSDMRDLLALEPTDFRASEAVALFCYQARKWIGSFAAALGGIDTLVFTGGIGENCPVIRSRICDGLDFLGIDLCEASNATNASVISSTRHRVSVRVIPANEELMIARLVQRFLSNSSPPADVPLH